MRLLVKRLDTRAVMPSFAYPGDAGMDLTVIEPITLKPGMAADVPTGLSIELPLGFWGRITGRSSTLRKRGLLVNEGVIDQGYRGPLFVYVKNLNGRTAEVKPGDRLAQLIVAPLVRPEVMEVEELGASVRGNNGFGSSGLRVNIGSD